MKMRPKRTDDDRVSMKQCVKAPSCQATEGEVLFGQNSGTKKGIVVEFKEDIVWVCGNDLFDL